jgi:O-antigen ligase
MTIMTKEGGALSGSLSDRQPANTMDNAAVVLAVLTTGAFVLFVTNLDLFLSVRGYMPINTLIIFLAYCAAVFGSILSTGQPQIFNRLMTGIVLNRLPFVLIALWIVVHVFASVMTLLSGEDVDYVQIFPIYQFGVLGFGVLLAAADLSGRQIELAARWAIVVLGVSIIAESVSPSLLGSTSARTGGFALNANIPGFIIPALLAVSLDFRSIRIGDLLAILMALVAVTCTLSRMGIGFLGLVIGVYFLFHVLRGVTEGKLRRLVVMVVFGVFLTALTVGTLTFLASFSDLDDEFRARIATLLGNGQVLDDPYRGPLLDFFMHEAARHPWIGYGAGETLMNSATRAPGQFGPHNIYVRIWVDTGYLGLAFYSCFVTAVVGLGIVRRSVSTTLIGVLVALYGAFSHNVTDNKAVLILLGVALGTSAIRASADGARQGRVLHLHSRWRV